jgi:hypothetical protein
MASRVGILRRKGEKFAMHLRVNGRDIPVRFEATDSEESAHTHKQLRTGTATFQVADPDLQMATLDTVSRASQGDPLVGVMEDGSTTEFSVRGSSYSSRGNGSPWAHSVDLREAERLMPDALLVDSLELKPYRYEERSEEPGIVITCFIEVDRSEADRVTGKLRQHQTTAYFPVVRKGLEDSPREMRFGRGCLWSEHGATTKFELILVEKAFDEANKPLPDIYPEIRGVMRQVARNTAFLDLLAADLVANGQLTKDRLLAIRQGVDTEEWDRVWALHRLNDVDPSRPNA